MPDNAAPKKTTAAKKPAATQGRTYIVLHQAPGTPNHENAWTHIGAAPGATDRQAIVNLIAGPAGCPTEGVFVAIPARSWRPVTRKVQTVEKALWS